MYICVCVGILVAGLVLHLGFLLVAHHSTVACWGNWLNCFAAALLFAGEDDTLDTLRICDYCMCSHTYPDMTVIVRLQAAVCPYSCPYFLCRPVASYTAPMVCIYSTRSEAGMYCFPVCCSI